MCNYIKKQKAMSHTVIYLCLNSTDISNTWILVSFFLKPCSHLTCVWIIFWISINWNCKIEYLAIRIMKIGHDKNPHHVYIPIWMWVIAPSYLFFCEILHHAQDCQNILVMIRLVFICYPKPKICLILPSFWFSMLQGCLHFADSILLLGGCLG